MTSGKAHPAAAAPAFSSHTPEGHDYTFAIQICGDFLGVFFTSLADTKNELVIWNWKTGAVKMVRTPLSPTFVPRFYNVLTMVLLQAVCGAALSSSAFLTDRYILVAVLGGFNTQIEPKLLVVDFTTTSSEMRKLSETDFQFECALHFPSMREWVAPLVLSIRSDPAPSWTPHPSLQVPFYIAHNDRLFVLTLWVAEEVNWKPYVIFLPSFTVLRHLHASLETKKRDVPWEYWGPEGVRFIEAPFAHSAVWVCFVNGLSFVSPVKPRKRGGPMGIQVFDFNQLGARKQLLCRFEDDMDVDEVTQVITDPTVIDADRDVFKRPVVTNLPYRLRTLESPLSRQTRFTAVMMSEDSIVLVCGVSLFLCGLACISVCIALSTDAHVPPEETQYPGLSRLDILRPLEYTRYIARLLIIDS